MLLESGQINIQKNHDGCRILWSHLKVRVSIHPTLPAEPGFLERIHWILPQVHSVSVVSQCWQEPNLFLWHLRGWAHWNYTATWPCGAVTWANFPDKTKNILDLREWRISWVFCWYVFKCNTLETQRRFAQYKSKRDGC